ncbi:hypothetical protein CLV32_3028 [Pedobacter duraquae]|uniref:Uncharacterized protein n=1 Tax=Pedobacter duraquae TaxID=425511 RepID=A0A4R6IIV6_9SPHI|nr:hypothetical protein CLV32_3028 [Pedobacter duraquae]
MKNKFTKKDHTRRYYLHSKIKTSYQVDAHKREVTVPYSEIDEARNNKIITELCNRFGYNIQTALI